MEVWEVYAEGEFRLDYSERYLCASKEVALAVAEREFGALDYYGKPIRWGPSKTTGEIYIHAHSVLEITIEKREILEVDMIESTKAKAARERLAKALGKNYCNARYHPKHLTRGKGPYWFFCREEFGHTGPHDCPAAHGDFL